MRSVARLGWSDGCFLGKSMDNKRRHEELAGILLFRLRNLIDGNQARADDIVSRVYEAKAAWP